MAPRKYGQLSSPLSLWSIGCGFVMVGRRQINRVKERRTAVEGRRCSVQPLQAREAGAWEGRRCSVTDR
jgi:hypothetical protein